MAKTSMVEKEKRRARTVKKYAVKRAQLKAVLQSVKATPEEQEAARKKLQSLPRNANPIRLRNRCEITGRSRGVYRKFKLGRSMLRKYAMRGEIPGLVKASW